MSLHVITAPKTCECCAPIQKLRVTEHTNGEEPYCYIDFFHANAWRSGGTFYGSVDDFRDQLDTTKFVIAEEIWD